MGELISHYQVIKKLGAGGMGEVYLARDTRLYRNVALKILNPEPEGNRDLRKRFLSEARAASALNHPNVCVIHEIGETEDGRPFIAMEFIEGQTLGQRIGQGQMEIAEIVEIGIQMADALDAAHSKGIVHRDIKPENICLDGRGRVKVLDFGLAKRLSPELLAPPEASITRSGAILGTPAYMSPEQALAKDLDHRTDLFSAGAVLYELVTGCLPFQGTSYAETFARIIHSQPEALARFNYNVPPELERIIRRCLEKDRERRYQSARELRLDLENLKRDLAENNAGVPPVDPAAGTLALDGPVSGDLDSISPDTAPPLRRRKPHSLEDLKKSDVFISYSHLDDQPLSQGRTGWISQFQRHLEVRLKQLSGEDVRVWRPVKNPDREVLDEEALEFLPRAKAMVTVLSPPFARSRGCRREVEAFLEGRERLGGLNIADRSRLLKVVKTPVGGTELGDLGRIFEALMGYEFYEKDPRTGRIREFDEVFGEEARQRYFERVYDLAYEIHQVLGIHEAESGKDPGPRQQNGAGKVIYLALTTSDLQGEYDSVRRELLEQGYRVVPDRPLPMVREELEQVVREFLAESRCIVQLVGRNYGLVPENARRSVLELQTEWAAARARENGIRRFIWLPEGISVGDERQGAFVRRLREKDAAEKTTELIEGTLTLLKDLLTRALVAMDAEKARPENGGPANPEGPPQIYLICDRGDEEAVEPLEDYLFNQGLELCLPDFDSEQEEVSQVHRSNLRECDAVLIYYGSARKSWVDIKLRDVLKASGYGRAKPFGAQAVYIAPPEDRRKERFRSHVAQIVIRQGGNTFGPAADLDSFVERVKGGR